jgi:hypothetical protein
MRLAQRQMVEQDRDVFDPLRAVGIGLGRLV